MSKENNLKDFLTSLANTMREMTGTYLTLPDKMNPQDFEKHLGNVFVEGENYGYDEGHEDGFNWALESLLDGPYKLTLRNTIDLEDDYCNMLDVRCYVVNPSIDEGTTPEYITLNSPGEVSANIYWGAMLFIYEGFIPYGMKFDERRLHKLENMNPVGDFYGVYWITPEASDVVIEF